MPYTFDQLFAADPSNPEKVAVNGVITIFAPGDSAKTPITITDTAGAPTPNPITVNVNGYGPAFMHETLDRVAWEGGGFTGFLTSYEGMKEEAMAARQASEASASESATSAQAATDAAALVDAPADQVMADTFTNPATASHAALSATIAETVYDVAGPTGTVAGDTAAVVAACDAAVAAGRKVVTLAPGHYQLNGLTVAQISDRCLVGDGVTFTPASNVYPFRSNEFATLSSNRGRQGGRGRIAIEVDDGLQIHWEHLFPLTKELGITVGSAWHTGNGSQWIAEAYRHGWEIIAHMPENITATDYLASGQLDAAAVSCLNAIEAQIGTRKGIGFVYPQHVRSAETDRVLSKYFTRGRGNADFIMYPRGTGHPWYTTARALDPQFAGGTMTAQLRDELRQIATLDGQAVFYMHFDSVTKDTQTSALRELVKECRLLGIEIVNPGQIWTDRNIVRDPYMQTAANWVPSGHATLDTSTSYHGGRSVKVTTPADAAGIGTMQAQTVDVPSRPGMFGVYRASCRYRADSDITVSSNGQGILWTPALAYRQIGGGSPSSGPGVTATPAFPETGTIIPASQWGRIQTLLYLGPATQRITPRITAQNLVAGSVPIWFDEVKLDHLDWVSQITYTVKLAGTGNVFLRVGLPDVARHNITTIPASPTAGKVSTTLSGSNLLIIKSTDATDTMDLKVVITPGPGYESTALSSTGA